MERMTDGSAGTCTPGTASAPNKWGMLIQALTGNMQPYYSCETYPRTAGTRFAREYSLGGAAPYDVDYSLPYSRPISNGSDQCVLVPYKAPGTVVGVGPGNLRSGGNATDFPDDALASVFNSYATSSANGGGMASTIPSASQCIFAQTPDGQLDAAKDYARFALMTFDSDTENDTGVNATLPLATNQLVGSPANPFKGQWSFRRHAGNPYYTGTDCTYGTPAQACNVPAFGAFGAPYTPGCTVQPFEVGARNEAAPPWEGRLIPFPQKNASLTELERTNEQIQRTLIATRPYGATPVDAMFDDARDYMYWYDGGPGASSGAAQDFKCRDNFIVLLTDGAPNLNLRPSCAGGSTLEDASGTCPYPKGAASIARSMLVPGSVPETAGKPKITTYVIGFAVAGESGGSVSGFPAGLPAAAQNCKGWFDDAAVGGGGNPVTMQTQCTAANPAPGTTANACCKLNDIALAGSQDGVNPPVGAFFAESQADIVFAFGRIMANVVRAASTRTVPAYTPTAQFSNTSLTGAGVTTSARFLASFIPNAQAPWSGELDRTRFQCNTAAPPVSTGIPQDKAQGDLMSVNLAGQSVAHERVVFTAVAGPAGSTSVVDSAATIRPYANFSAGFISPNDAIKSPAGTANRYTAVEMAMTNTLRFDGTGQLTKAMNITNTTCQRSRRPSPSGYGTDIVPPLGASDCTDVVWGFASAWPDTMNYAGYSRFNVRCNGSAGGGSSESGVCSIHGGTCAVGGTGCSAGETCVPYCSALGAVLHSNPLVVGAPNELLREEGFRTYQTTRRGRLPITYVATTDGLLHAFKAMATGGAGSKHELWSFIPPAVLPRLASNYPAGNQTLLDGTPVVAESIWERKAADTTGGQAAAQWHTTLVAGLGGEGGGYYALNVTDADCTNGTIPADPNTVACTGAGFSPAAAGTTLAQVSNSGLIDPSIRRGPHVLWQLTDVTAESGETAKVARSSNVEVSGHRQNMMALFGKHPGTPAIAMVQISNGVAGGPENQVGVAILPGGYDEPPQPTGFCNRGAATSLVDTTFPSTNPAPVRRWGSSCAGPIAGRSVTIVRLDNGEVIRHFARYIDTPVAIRNSTQLTQTDFDSPMTGTPVVYPSGVGVPAQKVFIGDADGTLWRIDLTSTNPANWSAGIMADLQTPALGVTVGNRQPIGVTPIISTNALGNVVIHVATGDQDSIVPNANERDVLFSLTETRDGTISRAKVNWFQAFQPAERVTGPMAVFDRTVYFATYRPIEPPLGAASCGPPGASALWGMDYDQPAVAAAGNGGLPRWCPLGSVDEVTGLCLAPLPLPARESIDDTLIPGVSMSTTSSCTSAPAIDETGGMAYQSITPVQYKLNYGASKINTSGGSTTPQAARAASTRQLPRNSTKIDSWSIVIE